MIRWFGPIGGIDELCGRSVEHRSGVLISGNAVEAALGACRLEGRLCLCWATIGQLWLQLTVLSVYTGNIVWRHGGQALRRNDQSHAGCVFGRTSRWSESAFEVPSGTSRTWKFLVALGLRFGTVAAGNRCSAGRLGNHAIYGWDFLLVGITTVDYVVSLEEIPVASISVDGIRE